MKQRAIIVPESVSAFLARGGRDIPLEWLGMARADPGRQMALLDLQGRPLGLAVADPENGLLRTFIRGDETAQALDESFFAARIDAALASRSGLGLTGEREAYRVIHGAGDGLPGIAADRLGPFAVLYVYARALLPLGRIAARALRGRAGLRGVVVKVRTRGAASQHRLVQETVGEPPPEKLVVEEHGVPFEAHPMTGLNFGLFTDMRESRRRFGERAAGKDVLNGFSYTGAFSVVAARAGAASVTSVDLSAGVQRWAQDNFRLSGLDPASPSYRFEAEDVGRYLERAEAEGRRFDLVLLDPPTHSEARGAAWFLERDYPGLIARACKVLRPGGVLWLASNTRAISLEKLAEQGLATAGRAGRRIESAGLPPEYPTLEAQPSDRYLQIEVFEVSQESGRADAG